MIVLKLLQLKTDPSWKGKNIHLNKAHNQTRPYKVYYCKVRESLKPSLYNTFYLSKFRITRKNVFYQLYKRSSLCGFNSGHYNGHSLRIGAATSAGKARI